jgi:hypothetical protein
MNRALFAAVLALPLIGAAPPSRPATITCALPVKKGDTAATLKARYGNHARLMKIHAAEGEMVDGMALWPNDPKRRIDVFFADRPGRKVDMVRIDEDKSQWKLGGIGIGSPLASVVAVNGRAVTVSGFGWDYGGAVDPKGGKLEKMPGGCRLGLTMDVGANAPQGVFGDGVFLGSDSALLKRARPRVVQMFISW